VNIHVDVTLEDQACSLPGCATDCMVHRALMRAFGKLGIQLADSQVFVNGGPTLKWYFQICGYEEMAQIYRESLEDRDFPTATGSYHAYCREEIEKMECWSREIPGQMFCFDRIGAKAVNHYIDLFEAGMPVPEFSFEFELKQQLPLSLDWSSWRHRVAVAV
jgi:hypothetical protein